MEALLQYCFVVFVAQFGTKAGQLKLSPEQLETLAELIETNNDATLEELCQMLEEKIGVRCWMRNLLLMMRNASGSKQTI